MTLVNYVYEQQSRPSLQVGDYNAISCLEFQKSFSPNQPPAHMLLPEGEGPETNNQFDVALPILTQQ